MSKPRITPPNYTQIPNTIFDYWMSRLTPPDFKVLMCICRKTFGWRKDSDLISISQIVRATGLSRRAVFSSLNSLCLKKIIIKKTSVTNLGDSAPNEYWVDVADYDEGDSAVNAPPNANDALGGSANGALPVVQMAHPQKKDHTKEKNNICRRKSQTTPSTPLASPSAQLVAAAAPTSCAFSSHEEELNEERKPKTQPAPLQTHPEAIRLAQKLLAKILAIHPKFKPPKLPNWSAEVERMHRLDGRTFEEIEEMIDYAFDKDPFWVDKLQCAKKLRIHFDKIWLKAHPPENEGTNIEKNRKFANQTKAYLVQFGENRFLTVYKNSVSRQNPYESVSFSLPPETFQSILANWFNLERGG